MVQAPALGDPQARKIIKIFDLPGIGDCDLPVELIIQQVREKITCNENINCILYVIKCNEYRLSPE